MKGEEPDGRKIKEKDDYITEKRMGDEWDGTFLMRVGYVKGEIAMTDDYTAVRCQDILKISIMISYCTKREKLRLVEPVRAQYLLLEACPSP